MIVFNLRCANDHVFEAWFNSSETYEAQASSGGVMCPHCGDEKVVKAPMAPNLATGNLRGMTESDSETSKQAREALAKVCSEVEANCDYVGDKFAEEARKIHYGETESANIYGEATASEEHELTEEGVSFGRIPWLPRSDS
jgi:hypothetical protein